MRNQQDLSNVINRSPNNIVEKNWTCPSCDRNIKNIIRKHQNSDGGIYYGYTLVRHHDHKLGKKLTNETPYVIICEACNKVDGYFKGRVNKIVRLLGVDKADITDNWSFSTKEIRSSISPEPNVLKHELLIQKGISLAMKKCGLNKVLKELLNEQL